ncbi:MAG: aldo/keto reductase [Candidatus Bathyarchaeia archaeon]|jgi:aryl-alcohol dehydrogenase-like predicted oxidoreductase
MNYVRLGDSGLKVSEICLGTWHLPRLTETDPYGIPKVDAEETRRVVNLAFDHGINFIDTANRYHGAMAPVDLNHYGNAEKVLSEILRDHERESFVLATKVGNEMAPWPNGCGLSRKHMFWQIIESLKRLKLEYVDVYLAHLPDEETPHLETLQAFNDLVAMGKVHYIGCSNFTTEQVIDFMELSKVHDLVSFVTLQDQYSLGNRSIESNKLPLARKYNFAIMAYSTLAQGLLSGRYLDGVPVGSRATYSQSLKEALSEKNLDSLRKLSTLASEKGISLSQLAIAWILHKQRKLGVNIIPIIGVSNREQLLENLQALEVHLSEDDMSKAEQIVLPIQI